tara:strand:- start:842 stop:1540 length:699 start_codon:yes stop_codon:yes gene_type:complete
MQFKEMSKNKFEAKIRINKGKAANQLLRKEGNIPAVLYGSRGNLMLEMVEEETRHLLEKMSGFHELMPIEVADSTKGESWSAKVLLREVQKHPYKHLITHLDFWEISDSEKQTFRVPVKVIGESPGVKSGGVLQMVVRDIPVTCLPSDIPTLIEVDSSKLNIGDSIRIQDLILPEKVSHSSDENYAVISIVGRVKEEVEESVSEESGDEAKVESSEDSKEEDSSKEAGKVEA